MPRRGQRSGWGHVEQTRTGGAPAPAPPSPSMRGRVPPQWARPPLGTGWRQELQISVYRIEKFLSKLCTVIFAQYFFFFSLFFFFFLIFLFFFFSYKYWNSEAHPWMPTADLGSAPEEGQLLLHQPAGAPRLRQHAISSLLETEKKRKKKNNDQNSIFVSIYLYMLSMALCYQLLSVLGLH